MGQESKDVESLQDSGRRRGSCLDIFLVASVVSLFVTLTALTIGGLLVVMELRAELRTKLEALPELNAHEHQTSSHLTGDPQADKQKQSYAYLEAIESELRNSTITWAEYKQGSWKSVGNNVDFNENQHSLKPKQEGSYLMFIDLHVSCTFQCNAGHLRVDVGELTCELELPATPFSVSRKCWTVSRLNGDRLIAQMTVSVGGMNNWKLKSSGSGFGMFLVN